MHSETVCHKSWSTFSVAVGGFLALENNSSVIQCVKPFLSVAHITMSPLHKPAVQNKHGATERYALILTGFVALPTFLHKSLGRVQLSRALADLCSPTGVPVCAMNMDSAALLFLYIVGKVYLIREPHQGWWR